MNNRRDYKKPTGSGPSAGAPASADQAADAPDTAAAPAPESSAKTAKAKPAADAAGGAFAGEAAEQTASERLAEQISEDLQELDELALAKAQAEEINDKYLRLKAEWDNYRRRTESERAAERRRAAQHLLVRILPVIDDLERAVQHSADADTEILREGVVQVLSKLTDTLGQEGLKPIDPKGELFDAHLHQAVSKQDDASVPEDTVLEVFQKGYELGERVLRPAMVVVASGGAPTATPDAAGDE